MLPNKDLIIYCIMFAVVKILSTDRLIEFQNNEKLLVWDRGKSDHLNSIYIMKFSGLCHMTT
jgi:hypothetical protein